MKILLKILVAPFALALSLLAALLVFLFEICAVLLTIASVILAVLGVALFFTPTPIGGIVFLFLAFRQLFLHWCSVGRTRPAALSRRRETGSGQAPFLRCIFLSESYHVTSILYVDPSGNPIADDLHHLLLPDSDDRVVAVEGRFAGLNSRRDVLVLINQAIRFMF
jgi:hypothetical protein